MKDSSREPLNIHFQTQNPDEKVYRVYRKSFVTNLDWIGILIAGTSLPLWAFPQIQSLLPQLTNNYLYFILGFWYLALFGFGLVSLAKWYFHVSLITDSRVLDIDLIGLLYRNVAEAHLQQIQDVSHTQGGLLQLVFNYGDVYIQTAATKQNIELINVPAPGEIHDYITDLAAQTH